jgi:hypothetical protein
LQICVNLDPAHSLLVLVPAFDLRSRSRLLSGTPQNGPATHGVLQIDGLGGKR